MLASSWLVVWLRAYNALHAVVDWNGHVQDVQKVSVHVTFTVLQYRPTFSRMVLLPIHRICVWHSWTTCLLTVSLLQPFGLQDLRIFLRPIFFLWGAVKNSVYSNNPHTVDDLKMAITEYIRNVDRAILNTLFENTVWRVNKCMETGGGNFEHYL